MTANTLRTQGWPFAIHHHRHRGGGLSDWIAKPYGVEAFKCIERLNCYIRMEKCSKRARSEPVWLPELRGWNGARQCVSKVKKRKVEEAEARRPRLSSTALAPEQESEPNRQLQKKLAVGIHPC